nr:uncharacterized protein LOC127336171 [Lolium perenne]
MKVRSTGGPSCRCVVVGMCQSTCAPSSIEEMLAWGSEHVDDGGGHWKGATLCCGPLCIFFDYELFLLVEVMQFSEECPSSCRLSRGTGVATGARRQRKASSKLPTQSDELQEVKHQLVYRRLLTGRPLLF